MLQGIWQYSKCAITQKLRKLKLNDNLNHYAGSLYVWTCLSSDAVATEYVFIVIIIILSILKYNYYKV